MRFDQHHEEPSNEELRLLTRRSVLSLLGLGGMALITGCGTDTGAPSASTSTLDETASSMRLVPTSSPSQSDESTDALVVDGDGSCVLVPEETAGPYPLDLAGTEAFFRTDITEGRIGVPLALELAVVDVNNECQPMEGARVDVWHTDAAGLYSGYAQPGADTTGETFMRGIQITDSDGRVTFRTVYPGWYAGRVTHIHFQIFFEGGLEATSQMAFPDEITTAVYAVEPYLERGPNTTVPSNADDMVFRDGTQFQMLSLSGDPADGYVGTLLVGVAL